MEQTLTAISLPRRASAVTPPKFFAWMLLLMLATVDESAQVSIVFSRGMAWWSPWLLKFGPLSLADLCLILLTGYTLLRLLADARIRPPVSRYSWILGLTGVYLTLGVIYNLTVYTAWKPFLYDFKCVLYLAVPYLFLHVCARDEFRNWFRPEWIFGLHTASILIDYLLVSLFGHSDIPSLTGFPGLPCLAMPAVTITGLIYAPTMRGKTLFLALLVIDVANALNRAAGFYLAAAFIAPVYMAGVLVSRKLIIRYLSVLFLVVGYHAAWIWMIVSPPRLAIVQAKSDGVATRLIQLQNLAINFQENIPGVLGKGLGSTWFEHVPVPSDDIYAVGTSLGDNAAESLDQPVKFIFNTPAAAILYKWGVVGILLQVYLIVLCYTYWERKLDQIARLRPDCPKLPMLRGALMVGFLIALDTVLFMGMLKLSLVFSLLMFYIERQTQLLWQETLGPGGENPRLASLSTTQSIDAPSLSTTQASSLGRGAARRRSEPCLLATRTPSAAVRVHEPSEGPSSRTDYSSVIDGTASDRTFGRRPPRRGFSPPGADPTADLEGTAE